MKDLIFLIPLLPFIGFAINGLFWKRMPKAVSGVLASAMILIAFILSLVVFFELKADPTTVLSLTLFDFVKTETLTLPFSFQVDTLTATFLLIITGIGFLIHLYSIGYMYEDEGYTRYFAYLNLFVFAMLILVMGANYVMMYMGWEGVALASYLLIGFWFKNKDYTNASKKAFIMNRVGDLGFLVGMMLLLFNFGTLVYADLFPHLAGKDTQIYNWIAISFFVGAMGKSAQIPLYTWLPDAMAGPTPVSALIHAATMVTAGIYMIARSSALYELAPLAKNLVAWVGLITGFFSATIALKQYDIKKVLAYSTVSQLGYMFLALGVGSYVGGVFHVMTHAFFKALLFLGAGSVIHAMHNEQDLRKMGGLKKKMPITHLTFLIACLAIAGIPGFSGFFSKDEILAATYAHSPIMYVIGLITAMMTAFYMFRLYFYVFQGSFRGSEKQAHHLHESPWTMTFPLIVLAVLSVVGGYIGLPHVLSENHILGQWLTTSVQNSKEIHHIEAQTEWMLMGLSTVLVIIMIFYAKSKTAKGVFTENTGIAKVLENKWYVDELYETVFVKPIFKFADFLNEQVEKRGIDKSVNGIGQFITWSAGKMRLLQSGQIAQYLFGFVIGMIILFLVMFVPLFKM